MNMDQEDDLDITAELPQLAWPEADAEDAALNLDSDTAYLRQAHAAQAGAISSIGNASEARQAKAPDDDARRESWRAMDELVSVRDKIVDLEASLLDAEVKLAKLDKQYQELQTRHTELQTHDAELARDRDRIDAERALLVESRQQLTTLFERHRADAEKHALAMQTQLTQQHQKTAALQTQLADEQQRAQAEYARYEASIKERSAELSKGQTEIQSLTNALQNNKLARKQQEGAAAALARTLSREMLEKQALQATLEMRDLRIGALEQTQLELDAQLSTSKDRHQAALTQIEQLQATLTDQTRQITELQAALTASEQRSTHISEQLETERGRVRSGEQDQERLTRLAAAEHASYESARQELASRVTEVKTLQEQLAQSRTELDALQAQLTERDTTLRSRDELLAAKQQTLQLATDNQAAATIRESALTESLAVLQENLRQTQTALQERAQALQTAKDQLAAERAAAQQAQEQSAALQKLLQQTQDQQQERDRFIIEQASELERTLQRAEQLGAQLAHEQAAHEAQRARVLVLEGEHAPLRTELAQQTRLLTQAQQELDTKQQEHGASAEQVKALQEELHQHVEALTAIRRDIHQVAQQSRYRESELLVRTLIRADDESVVHLLNKPVMVIGRANDAEICIRADSISRRHACLRVGRDVVIVEDLGSTNGCYVNGKRIKRQLLKDGDKLEIGAVQFRFATRATQS